MINSSHLPFISIVILNYNSMTHLRDNLDALLNLDYPTDCLELLLVDNNSTDGSTEWVAATYPTIRIVRNKANLGYAAGNSSGVQAAQGDWIAILNPDVRVESTWLKALVQPTLHDEEVVCVASRMLSWDGKAIDFADAAMNFMGWGCQPGYQSQRLNEFAQDKPLLFACGGAMLIKRDVFLEVGGFDADYFAYYEDVDLGWRLWLAGYKVVLAAQAIAYHRHHGSWGDVHNAKKWLLSERNTLFTLIKNYDDDSLARVLPAALLLVAERAYLDIQPDPPVLAAALPSTHPYGAPLFGPRYYLGQIWQLLRQGDLRSLWQKSVDEIKRRLSQPNRDLVRPAWQRTPDGRFLISPVPLSRLLAAHDVLQALPALLEKRWTIQSRRQRNDADVFPLFQWALISNFGDESFIQAMNVVVARFGLVGLFNQPCSQPLPARVRQLSDEVSLRLMQMMSQAFLLSGAPEAAFRIGREAPESALAVPESCIALVGKLHQLLWTLPDVSLQSLLSWLKERIE